MENNLYVISNINMQTVELVAKCLRNRYKDGFKKIVLFESPEAEKYEYEQISIYRKYFGEFEKTVVLLNQDGSIPTEALYSVFNTDARKVIDLSNGQKVTTASLYFASALCRVEDIYCLVLHGKPSLEMAEGTDFEYIKFKQIHGVDRIAKLSYFDLIYYTEDVNAIISKKDVNRSAVLKSIFQGMMIGIKGFFTGEHDARSVINNVTIGNEAIIGGMLNYLKSNQDAIDFAREKKIELNRDADPVGILSFFFKKYANEGENAGLISLCTVPGLLSGLRDYRNISAHYSKNRCTLTDDNARTVIGMQIEVLKRIHENSDFWGRL